MRSRCVTKTPNVLGTYQSLQESAKPILLDFSKVEYLNSSGIALVIQMMIAANKRGQAIQTFGLNPHFQRVFTMMGITKYTRLHLDDATIALGSWDLDGKNLSRC
jgi:anti-sigma B factor antagonist